jgi:hypothetical protein
LENGPDHEGDCRMQSGHEPCMESDCGSYTRRCVLCLFPSVREKATCFRREICPAKATQSASLCGVWESAIWNCMMLNASESGCRNMSAILLCEKVCAR